MKPWITLATESSPHGKELVLQERDGVFVIRVGGQELMSSASHGSEEAMAEVGLAGLAGPPAQSPFWERGASASPARPPRTVDRTVGSHRGAGLLNPRAPALATPDQPERGKDFGRDVEHEAPSVLIGGLGLGYTLRAALDRLPTQASVVVVEISAAVVAWNRGPLAQLTGAPLNDPRVTVEVAEIGLYLATTRRRFDAILLDVDNGPSALSRAGNEALYRRPGLAAFSGALRPRGALVVWSASEAPRFVAELSRAGFDAKEQRVTGRHGGGNVLILGRPRRVRSRR